MKKILLIFSVVSFGVIVASAQLPENTQRAIKAFENQKWEEGFRLSKDADLNDKSIQFYLGVMYMDGRGVPKDDSEAVKWYRKAVEQYRKSAEQGYARAQYNLGVMYANGRGVAKDESEAVKWYRKSAEQGNVGAQFYLGFMYENGEGVTKDDSEAVKWFRKAAAQGFPAAKEALKRLGWVTND